MKSTILAPLAIFIDNSFRSTLNSVVHSTITANDILQSDVVCNAHNILIVNYPGLTVDDLYAMPNSSPLAQQYQLASLKTLEMNNLEPNRVGSILSEKCGLPAATHSNELNAKGIISMSLPRIDDENHNSRKELVSGAVSQIYKRMAEFKPGSSSVVIIEGLPLERYIGNLSTPPLKTNISPFFSRQLHISRDATGTIQTGLLHKYQLLTPALLLTTLVSVLILFPIIWFGISALSSIEIPTNIGDIAKSERRS